jgi:FkbM family methyltransferase
MKYVSRQKLILVSMLPLERRLFLLKLVTFLRKLATFFIRCFISILPNYLSVILGKLGYLNCIKRSSKVQFVAKIYQSNLSIHVRGDYGIERIAAMATTHPQDPFNGIRQLGLRNFSMLDIGANVGTISIGSVGIGATKIYAIEPGPLYSRLENNILLNNLSRTIYPFKIGFSKKKGEMYWAEDLNNPGNAHLLSSFHQLDHSKIPTKFGSKANLKKVQVVTLDGFINKESIDYLDLIKIDVEGMEWEVLSGGIKTLTKFRPIVVAETHRVASDMMRYDCMTPMFNMFYSLDYYSMSLNDIGILTKFIYPNFGQDTFFIPKEYKMLHLKS